jgi:hypothetical protein
MPLPLPNLDTRRWSDLVDEGRALIPRFAPGWTDHNVHDPGITLIELFAFLTESLLYRANRIPERHRRKFLALLGYPALPPTPARCVLGATLPAATAPTTLPRGAVLTVDAGAGVRLPFRSVDAAPLVGASLVAVQSFDGRRFVDRSRAVRELLPVPLFGPNPALPKPYSAAAAPAFLLGFDVALPKSSRVRLSLSFAGAMRDERRLLLDEATEIAADCARPPATCTPRCEPRADVWCADDEEDSPLPSASTAASGTIGARAHPRTAHPSVRVVFDFLAADGWHPIDAGTGEVEDETRGLTLDGLVTLRVPGDMSPAVVGVVTVPRYWLRCRLVRGSYDSAPMLRALTLNPIVVEQTGLALERFVIDGSVVPVGTPVVGERTKLRLDLDTRGVVRGLDVGVTDADVAELFVVDYEMPVGGSPGSITLDAVRLLDGTGLPEQHPSLSDAPVAHGVAKVWTLERDSSPARRWVAWQQRADLDSAKPLDARFALAPTTGELHFGDGVRGRVPPEGATVLAAFESTSGSAGNVAAGRRWALPSVALNHALLGASFSTLAATTFTNPLAADGGADEEEIGSAAARAAAALWSHERLVRLCPTGDSATLDQLDRAAVLDLPAPERATTLLDFERIALEVPGTRVRRARAWAELDPSYACLEASGTVTVVIVPELPLGRPSPSAGLRRAVHRWLDRRRVLCTRLVVVGPEYLTISVSARVRTEPGADAERVRADVDAALAAFLDPLHGGPASRGWPFGRDVYRSEILSVVDRVRGVDHVLALSITADGREVACGNVCVPPTWLVASGSHVIETVTT